MQDRQAFNLRQPFAPYLSACAALPGDPPASFLLYNQPCHSSHPIKVSKRTSPMIPSMSSHHEGPRNLRSQSCRPIRPSRTARSCQRSIRILSTPPKGFTRYIFRPCLSGLEPLTRLGETPRPVASVTIVSNRNLTIIESRFRIRITAIFCIMCRLPSMWKTIRYDTVVRIRMVTNRPRPVRGVGRGAIRRSGRFGGARRIPYHVGKGRKKKIGQAWLR